MNNVIDLKEWKLKKDEQQTMLFIEFVVRRHACAFDTVARYSGIYTGAVIDTMSWRIFNHAKRGNHVAT